MSHEKVAGPEKDPTGKKHNEKGAKLDGGKIMADLLVDFARALTEVARVSTMGALKYSRGGWQDVKDGPERYSAAMWRHLLKEKIEGRFDSESSDPKVRHAAQIAWNALARLDLTLREEEAAAVQTRLEVPATLDLAQLTGSAPRILR